jgi:hypothetical protein
MEYNSENMKLKNPPPAHLKLKYLKIDMIRVSILKEFILKNNYFIVFQKAITERRTIINS